MIRVKDQKLEQIICVRFDSPLSPNHPVCPQAERLQPPRYRAKNGSLSHTVGRRVWSATPATKLDNGPVVG